MSADRKAARERAKIITLLPESYSPKDINLAAAFLEVEAELEQERKAREEAQKEWRCFHCGFETSDAKEAGSHFGDRDDAQPACLIWSELNADGRLKEFQSQYAELECERDENAKLRSQVEALEYQVGIDATSFRQRMKCSSAHEAFCKFDSMEGEMLAEKERAESAEQRAADLQRRLEEAEAATIERCARVIRKVLEGIYEEYGSYDPDTGATEISNSKIEDRANELEELEEAIRALAGQTNAAAEQAVSLNQEQSGESPAQFAPSAAPASSWPTFFADAEALRIEGIEWCERMIDSEFRTATDRVEMGEQAMVKRLLGYVRDEIARRKK